MVVDVFRRRSYGAFSSSFVVVEGEGRLFEDCSMAVAADDDWAFFYLLLTSSLSSPSASVALEANTAENYAAHANFSLSSCCSEGIGNQ